MKDKRLELFRNAKQAAELLPTLQMPDLPETFPGYVTELNLALEEAKSILDESLNTRMEAPEIVATRNALREELRTVYCRRVVTVAHILAQTDSVFDRSLFNMPYQSLSHSRFHDKVQNMLNAVRDFHRKDFIKHGITDKFISDFEAKFNAYQDIGGDRFGLRSARKQNRLKEARIEIRVRNAMKLIDSVLYPYFAQYPEVLSAWQLLCPSSKLLGPRPGRKALQSGRSKSIPTLVPDFSDTYKKLEQPAKPKGLLSRLISPQLLDDLSDSTS